MIDVRIPITKPIIVDSIRILLVDLKFVLVAFEIVLPPWAEIELRMLFPMLFIFGICYCRLICCYYGTVSSN